MNNLNSIQTINTANATLNKVAEKVAESANEIFSIFHWESTGFAWFGGKGESWLTNDYFDKVIKNILLIKKNLQEAKIYISQTKLDYKDVEIFVTWTQDTLDSITNLMREDLYFSNTFGYAMEEIFDLVKELREEIVLED